MLPIAFVTTNDPDTPPLHRALQAAFHVVPLPAPPTPDDLLRVAPAALVVQAVLSAPILAAVRSAYPDGGLPALVLADPSDLETTGVLCWDDFAVRPWSPAEVTTRLRRLLRGPRAEEETAMLRWGRLTLDEANYEVRSGNTRIDLTFTEFRLLAFLMAQRGRVATREACYKAVWQSEHFGGIRTVDVHIRRLRSKLEAKDCSYIATVRNVGYRLVYQNPLEGA